MKTPQRIINRQRLRIIADHETASERQKLELERYLGND